MQKKWGHEPGYPMIARRLDVLLPAGDGGLDDFFHDVAPQGLKCHLLGVLD